MFHSLISLGKGILVLVATGFLARTGAAQTQIDLRSQARNVDFAGAASTRPMKVGTTTPANCSIGDQFFRSDAAPGQNVYLCTAANTWTPVAGTGGGGASAVSGMTDCRVSRASDDTLVVAACNVRVGTKGWSFPETSIVLNAASPADTVRVFIQNGSLVAGHNHSATTLTGSGFTSQEGITEFPAESLPIVVWGADDTPGRWDASGQDLRVLLQTSTVTPGVGLSASDSPTTGLRTLSVDTATTPQFSVGTANPAGNCTVGQRYVRTDTNREWACTSPNTWTEVTGGSSGTVTSVGLAMPTQFAVSGSPVTTSGALTAAWNTQTANTMLAGPTGGAAAAPAFRALVAADLPALSLYYTYPAATCQLGGAATGFATPAANAPTPACVAGANAGDPSAVASAWNFGTLSFAENASAATAQSIQGAYVLPPGWSSTAGIDVAVKWRTSATSDDVVWQIQGQCVADGEAPGDFSSAVAFTADTAKGTTLQFNDTVPNSLTTSDVLAGCAAGEWFLFRFFRDATHAGDTLAAAAELISLRFKVTRTE